MSMSGERDPAFEEFAPRRPFTSLFSTSRDVLLSPRRFFDGMPPDGPARGPVAYLLAWYLISALLTILFAVLLLFPVVGLAVLFAPPSDPTDLMTTVGGVLAVALIGVLALGALYLVSALLFFLWIPFQHAFVLLFARRSQRGVVATARLSCYAAGATMLFSWLPVVGILAIPYSIYLLTTGLKRVHRASNLRALAATLAPTAISFVLLVAGASFAFGKLADALPATAFGLSEEEESLPPDAVDYSVLEVGRPGHDRFRELRADSYAQGVPRARHAVEVLIATTIPPGQEPRGVIGRAKDSGHNGVYIGPAEPTSSVGDEGDEINYIASVRESGSYVSGELEESGSLYQDFFFRGQRPYTVELKQVSQGWHTLYVRSYSARDPGAKESVACFTVPYASVESGDRLKLTVEPGEPFSDLLMKVDRDADGVYEES
jgi:hypothetical protein